MLHDPNPRPPGKHHFFLKRKGGGRVEAVIPALDWRVVLLPRGRLTMNSVNASLKDAKGQQATSAPSGLTRPNADMS
jgi:hypothetical protein